ncbi:hypothetical protein JCM10450v2_007023 [Rhodotorula kratochvilovae]
MSWLNPFAKSSSNTSIALDGPRYPGKASGSLAPPPMKRTASMCSLPSPPADYGEDGMDVDEGMADAPSVPSFGAGVGVGDDEVDQLDSDYDEPAAPASHHGRTKPRASRPCMLGSPAVLIGGGGAPGLASRKQLLNPFLPPAASSSTAAASSSHAAGAPLSPSASPVRPLASPSRRRHRHDPDRIRLTTPPPPALRLSEAELAAERERAALEERRRAMGWDDPENPFVERDDEMARRIKEKKPVQRPETITYVKRGQRIKTSVPFTAVLTSSSPSEDPFTFTAPKLLFPPAQPPSPTLPSTPPKQSKFLEALRAAGAPAGAGEKKDDGADELPPTPATLKRKAPAGGEGARALPYKRMRAIGEGAEARGLR